MEKLYEKPVIGGRGYKGFKMDGKLCFELWTYRGTAKKAAIALQREFKIYNKRLNKRFTTEAVMRSAKLWALLNEKEARAIYEDKYGEVSTDLWYDYLLRISHLLVSYSPTSYDEWKEANPEIMEYARSLSEVS